MTGIIIRDLLTDLSLDKAALAKILGGSGTAVVGSGNTVAVGGCAPIYQPIYKGCHMPCYPQQHYGPTAWQLNYSTSCEQSYYQKAQTSLNLSYFQG